MNTITIVSILIFFFISFSISWMIFVYPGEQTPTRPVAELITQEPTTVTKKEEPTEINTIKSSFSQLGECAIENKIYAAHSVCWEFTKTFRQFNPRWSELTLGKGQSFGTMPHSVAYLRRNNTSAYVHDAWGGDTFILEFDEGGNFTFWNTIEDVDNNGVITGIKTLNSRNGEWLKEFNHFHFDAHKKPTGARTLLQDNRLKFIKGEI